MEDTKKNNKNTKWLILIFLLLILLVIYFFSKSRFLKKVSPQKSAQKSSITEIKLSDTDQSEPQKIIKCQSVVVGPKSTTELFTYVSGNKIRADYRIGANTEEDSFKTQIFYDGEQVYLWKPPINYGDVKPENPLGQKMKLNSFKFDIELTELGIVSRFGNTPLSGDHLCSEWDDDSVFEVPSDFTFEESDDIYSKMSNELTRICQICDSAGSDDTKIACQKNLVCN